MGAPRRTELRRSRGHRAPVWRRSSCIGSSSLRASSRVLARRVGRRRSRRSDRAASSSHRSRAPRRIPLFDGVAENPTRARGRARRGSRSRSFPAAASSGSPSATMKSLRRGSGTDVAGSRPYRPGDDIDSIDWAASARLSTARGSDEFVVRERYAEEAPKVAVVCDRRPEMAHGRRRTCRGSTSRGNACRRVGLVERAVSTRGVSSPTSTIADGDPYWRATDDRARGSRIGGSDGSAGRLSSGASGAMAACSLTICGHRRAVPPAGSFVFLLSDFLEPLAAEDWLGAIESRWDVVPVVIQDPVWEQSFPDVSGMAFPFADPRTGRVAHLRLTPNEVSVRRARNEERLARVVGQPSRPLHRAHPALGPRARPRTAGVRGLD